MNVPYIIMILGALWMIYFLFFICIFLALNENKVPKNLGTFNINCFLDKAIRELHTVAFELWDSSNTLL